MSLSAVSKLQHLPVRCKTQNIDRHLNSSAGPIPEATPAESDRRILPDLVRIGRIWSELIGIGRIRSELIGFGRIWSDFDFW